MHIQRYNHKLSFSRKGVIASFLTLALYLDVGAKAAIFMLGHVRAIKDTLLHRQSARRGWLAENS